MGAAAVEQRARGINPFQTDIGVLILLNLVLSFVISNVSIGGHIGGLVGGILVGVAFEAADRMGRRELGYLGCVVLSAIAVVGALAAAGS
jgi:membrane associated rhomboid family serine protease